jgi:GNAT superfamily N-acetyltransferase
MTSPSWHVATEPDERLHDELSERLVEHNQAASDAIRLRFEPGNLRARTVEAYALDDYGELVGGCVGSTEDVWQWLTIDVMWVSSGRRREGVGRLLLETVEEQARARGCRWAKLNTWEFQAPDFYAACGYAEYGQEVDYPPGHVNHLMRKDL